MSINYSQYLTTLRCCNLNTGGPQGPQGATGPASVGPIGYQGVTGVQGSQGATGRSCKGPTGSQGATGYNPWLNLNGIGPQGVGYTGIGVTGIDVLIYGNLLVTGAIDPTSISFTPQASGPTGSIWYDNQNNIRLNNLLVDNGLDMNSNNINNVYSISTPNNVSFYAAQNVIFLDDSTTSTSTPGAPIYDNQRQVYINARSVAGNSVTINLLNSVVYGGIVYTISITLQTKGDGIELIWNTTDGKWYVPSKTDATFS
jgi:hypothetical protein